ncbi:MAG: HD-GYP domain-containing protein [Planctomycetota bacterium]|jgi:HD-GYP domain-containing protein (c-di-GMP phosphodiesterase class II)
MSTQSLKHADVMDGREVLRQRCHALQLPTAMCLSDGSFQKRGPIESPLSDPAIKRFLASPFIERRVREHAEEWCQNADVPQSTELYPGLWVVPLPMIHRRKCLGFMLAFAFSPSALSTEHFQAACQSASLDDQSTRASFASLAVYDAKSVSRISFLLSWAQQDRTLITTNEVALTGFSRQLTESFEEISLLYKLGRSMNEVVNPRRFVQMICDELHATLTFRWIVLHCFEDDGMPSSLSGRTFQAGDPPWRVAKSGSICRSLSDAHATDSSSVISSEMLRQIDDTESYGQLLLQPLMRDGQHIGVIVAGDKQSEDTSISSVDMKLVDAAAQNLLILLENVTLYEDQQAMFLGTLGAITAALDAKDRYTCGHSERVALLSARLARAAGLDERTCERIRISGLVHDVGKIGVREAVLRKPGRLTEEEFLEVRAHPVIGYRILKDIPQLNDVLLGVLHHHERWDGEGYPDNLASESIPLVARIIGIADAYDAMRSTRTYRDSMAHEKVLAEITRFAGVQFDPGLVPLFVNLDFSEFNALIATHIRREATGRTTSEAA